MIATTLLQLAGAAHLISFTAIVVAPIRLRWDEELARLPKLLRQMCHVYCHYTGGTIVALGLVSLLCAPDLVAGTPLARAVCGYTAVFWAARLWLQRYYDFRPHLTTAWLRLGYHSLTALFIVFVAIYGWGALHGLV
ncbi:MAG: hypothetical protein H7343_01320 [Undibacterium sp.]|nr:hypothetical protein [Opitutaceae bacterium]